MFPLVGAIADIVRQLASLLDTRSGFRLAITEATDWYDNLTRKSQTLWSFSAAPGGSTPAWPDWNTQVQSLLSEADLEAIRTEVDREIEEATDRALEAPTPTADTVKWWVYSSIDPTSREFDSPPEYGESRDLRMMPS